MSLFIDHLPDLTNGEQKTYRILKNLYENTDYQAYLYIQPRLNHFNPDFILVDPYKGICIIEVKSWLFKDVKIDRNKVSFSNGSIDMNPVAKTNTYHTIMQTLVMSDSRLSTANINIYSRVIFDLIDSDYINNSGLNDVLNMPPSRLISNEMLNELSFDMLFDHDSHYIDNDKVEVIRFLIDPVVKLSKPENVFRNVPDSQIEDIDKTFRVLDLKQEDYAKRIPYGHYMLSGVPGSGKTVILIARAIHLLKLNPEWNIRIITYNRSLKSYLESVIEVKEDDFRTMGIDASRISVSTFHNLALFISGERVPLSPSDDWWTYELPKIALEKAKPIFDAVLIDEYQDFYDDWIKLCLKTCKKHTYNEREPTENIFLTGDRLQSIYNAKEHTWESIGINIKGNRSNFLKHSYRTAKYHFDRALEFLKSDPRLAQEVDKFYEGGNSLDCEDRENQSFKELSGSYHEIVNYINTAISFGIKPKEILIVVPTRRIGSRFFSCLPENLKIKTQFGKNSETDNMFITTYHSAKGLERRLCFLLDSDFISSLEPNEIMAKKLLYVGMTRASEGLFLHRSQ